MNPEEITKQSLESIDIKSLALNKNKLGSLTFDESYPLLEELRSLFVELKELNYEGLLLQDEIQQIERYIERFLELLKRLAKFDPSVDSNFNKMTHDAFENEVQSFHNEVFRSLRGPLVYLRQEAARKAKDEKLLEEERKAVTRARKQTEELVLKLQKEYERLQKEKTKIEKTHGEVAAKYLAVHFDKQAKEYEEEAKKWLSRRNIFYYLLIVVIAVNFIAYLSFFFLYKFGEITISPREIFTIEYGLIKLAIVATLSYGLSFASKNYTANAHLSAVNKHRRNVAQTLEDFLATDPDRKEEMLKQATEAMFKHAPIGFIKHLDQKEIGPIEMIINRIINNKE